MTKFYKFLALKDQASGVMGTSCSRVGHNGRSVATIRNTTNRYISYLTLVLIAGLFLHIPSADARTRLVNGERQDQAELRDGVRYRITKNTKTTSTITDSVGFFQLKREEPQKLVFKTINTSLKPSNFTFRETGDGFKYIVTNQFDNRRLGIERTTAGEYRFVIRRGEDTNSDPFKWKIIPYRIMDSQIYGYLIQSKLGVYISLQEGIVGNERNAIVTNERPTSSFIINKHNAPLKFQISYLDLGIDLSFCPTTLVGGDREFAGNGPNVSGEFHLAVGQHNRIYGLTSFRADESRRDFSQVIDRDYKRIVASRRSWKLIKITSPQSLKTDFRHNFRGNGPNRVTLPLDPNYEVNPSILTTDGPIKSLVIQGDTGGTDISDNSECSDDTRIVSIDLNPITVMYEYSPE